jgi:hypothetical protein
VPNQHPEEHDELEGTIEALRRKKQAIMEEAHRHTARLDRMIQAALEDATPSAQVPAAPTNNIPSVRPGQFNGMEKFAALFEYLRERSGLGPIHVSKIRKDLLVGGVTLSESVRRGMTRAKSEEATLLTTAHSHPDVLVRNKKERTIWLKSTGYSAPPLPKRKSKRV